MSVLSFVLFCVGLYLVIKVANKWFFVTNLFLFVSYTSLFLVYLIADYFTDRGIDETVYTTMQLGVSQAGFYEYKLLIFLSIIYVILMLYLMYKYIKYYKTLNYNSSNFKNILLGYFIIIIAFISMPAMNNIYNLYSNFTIKQTNDFYKYYKQPNLSLQKNKINKKYNIVYIYAESLERTYFNEKIFPNLIKNLKDIQSKSLDFTNIKQVKGTGNTISGVVSSQCGIPLFTTSDAVNNMGGLNDFLPKAICLGDILKENNYYLSELQGSSIEFSGIGKFYKTHQFDTIEGVDELKKEYKNINLNGWGLYDDSMLDIAFNKFIKLSQTKENFALFLATMDTHHPNGQLSPSCRDDLYKDGSNSILNCVKCSDKLIAEFIKKIRKSKYSVNTIIVLTSDHLAMHNTAIDKLRKAQRRDLFLVNLPNNLSKKINKVGTPFDIGSTIINFLDSDINIGLGRNLLEEDSLINNFTDFNKKLLSWREEILKFWNFPEKTDQIQINVKEKKVIIDNQKLQFPVILKIDKYIKPIFEQDTEIKLYQSFSKFKSKQKYIWIDQCSKLNKIFNLNKSFEGYCAVIGKRDYQPIVKIINQDFYTINNLNTIFHNLNNKKCHIQLDKYSIYNKLQNKGIYTKLYKTYKATLEEGIDFSREYYPDFIKAVIGMSHKEPWGRWSDATLGRNVTFIFEHKLPKKFDLKIKVQAYGKNIGKNIKVVVGDKIKEFKIESASLREYSIPFNNVDADSIKFIIPYPTSPDGDSRKLGLGFEFLKITQSKSKEKIQKINKKYAFDTNRFIAHAGGAIDNNTYTDSLDALNYNYNRGFKLFELDIVKTLDDKYVAAHDWKSWKEKTGYIGNIPTTQVEFLKHKILKKYKPLDIDKINKWFKDHKDTILVTDKINEPVAFSKKFIDAKRLRMELFSWKAVFKGMTTDIQVMPTWGILYQIEGNVGNIVEYLRANGIKYIAASRHSLVYNKEFLKELKKAGIKVYAFHIHKPFDEKYMLCNEMNYFYGIYADNWDFTKSNILDMSCDRVQNSESSDLRKLIYNKSYNATLEDGINFSRNYYPDFIKAVIGMSHQEPWGRWSDATLGRNITFVFEHKLPRKFNLQVKLQAYGKNVGKNVKVVIGDQIKEFKLESASLREYNIPFNNVDADTIKFIVPYPTSPEGDSRKLGIGFQLLKIIKK